MSKPSFGAALLLAAGCLFVVPPARAQVIQVDVTGLPPGATVELVLVAANMNKTEQTTALPTGDAALAFDFANLGKTERAPQEQIQVFILDCRQPNEVRRVVLVAEGGQVPQECDEQRADTQKGCSCRRAVFILLNSTTGVRINFQTGAVQALTSGAAIVPGARRYWFTIGGGAEISRNGDIGLSPTPPDERFGPAVGTVEEGGTSGTFLIEFMPIPWLGLGYSYQSLSTAELHETFSFLPNPVGALGFDAEFNPKAHVFYGIGVFPAQSRVQVVIRGGINYFTSEETATQSQLSNGQVVSSRTSTFEASGTGPMGSLGLRFWPWPMVGFEGRYTYEKLQGDSDNDGREVDDEYQKFAFIGLVRF
jgi:hypothetical protein